MVLVNLLDLDGQNYYYYYPSLLSLGLDDGRWIIIEPQTTIENQYTPWIASFSIEVATELDYDN